MAREEQITEGPPPEPGPPPGGSGGPAPEAPLPTSCEGLDSLLGALKVRLASEQERLENTPKRKFVVRLKIQGAIDLLNDMIGKVNAKRDELGCK